MIQPFPEFWNTSDVTNYVDFPFGRGVCNALVRYGINTTSSLFYTHSRAHTSKIEVFSSYDLILPIDRACSNWAKTFWIF